MSKVQNPSKAWDDLTTRNYLHCMLEDAAAGSEAFDHMHLKRMVVEVHAVLAGVQAPAGAGNAACLLQLPQLRYSGLHKDCSMMQLLACDPKPEQLEQTTLADCKLCCRAKAQASRALTLSGSGSC